MGNSWPAEWALDYNRWMWWQYTYSLQGQHCYEAIFLIHKNSYNPAYNLHRIYSTLAAAEVWADSSFVWIEHKENKMTLKSAAHLLKKKQKTHLPVPFLYGCCQVRETFCNSQEVFFVPTVRAGPILKVNIKKKKQKKHPLPTTSC